MPRARRVYVEKESEGPEVVQQDGPPDPKQELPLKGKRGRPPKASSAGGGAYFSPPSATTRFSSGCTLLDCVLGGGWAIGRVCNIVGDKSVGKSLLAIEAAANFLKEFTGGKVVYVETEAAFDQAYAKNLGIPINKIEFPNDDSERPIDTVEKLFNRLDEELTASEYETLFIVDSLDALSDDAEMERGIGDSSFGAGKAKKLSELFRRLNQQMAKKKFCVLIVSQVRDAIGVMFGKKHVRSGGKALDFYASQIVWLNNMGKIVRTKANVKRAVGVKVRAKCEKNKIGLPFRECDFPIYFNYGVEDVLANLEFLESVKQTSLDGEKIDAIISRLEDMPQEEYDKVRDLSKVDVVSKWNEIEHGFSSDRRKY